AIAIVVVQDALAVVRHEQVGAAVVVVIADARALPPARPRKPCGGRHVLETKLALIAVEMAGRLLSFPVAVEGRPVRQEDVHQPVAVEIENGHAVARRLEVVLLLVLAAGEVYGSGARLHRHVAYVFGYRMLASLE